MTYDRLSTADLRGTTQADYLTAIDAHLRVLDGGATLYDEPGFPVVELARSLLVWLENADAGDFEFDSMSYEETGAIAIRQVGAGWTIGSAFVPGVVTTPAARIDVEDCCNRFIARVAVDLEGLGLKAAEVLKR